MSLLQLIVTSVLVLTATTGGVAYAANASNPGDYLHGLDLAMENAQLNLTSGVSNKVQLRLQFASERLAEAQATFSKNDVTDGLEAINEYDAEISATAQLVGSANGADPEALATLLETAQGVHQDVLKKLLDEVPDQAKDAIQKALDVSNNPGKPDGTSNPNSSNPNGVGNPNTIGTPGADISACAKSLSQQDAQTLANLAKKYGVDYQYVLENFCALGTLEKVQKMLSTLQGPPTTIPNGSPASSSANPPVNPPGRP